MSESIDLPPKKRKLDEERSISDSTNLLKQQNSNLLTRLKDKRNEISSLITKNEGLKKECDGYKHVASSIKSLWGKFIGDIDIFCEKESFLEDKSIYAEAISRYVINTDERLEELSTHAGLRIGQLKDFITNLKEQELPSQNDENLRASLEEARLELNDFATREANLKEEVSSLQIELNAAQENCLDLKHSIENMNIRLAKAQSLAREIGTTEELPDVTGLKSTISNLEQERDTLLSQRDEQIKKFQELRLQMEVSEERFIQSKAFKSLIEQANTIKRQMERLKEENIELKKLNDENSITRQREIEAAQKSEEGNRTELRSAIEALQEQCKDLENEKSEAHRQMQEVKIQMGESKSMNEFKGLLDSAEKERTKLKDQISKLKAQNKDMFAEKEEEHKQLLIFQDSSAQNERTITELNSQLEALTKPEAAPQTAAPEEGSLEARIENYRNQVLTLRKQIKERDDTCTDLKGKNQSLEHKIKSEQSNNDSLLREIDQTERAYAEMSTKNTSLVSQISEKDKQLSGLQLEQQKEKNLQELIETQKEAFEERLSSTTNMLTNQKEVILAAEDKDQLQQEVIFSLQKTLQEIEGKLLRYEANDNAARLEELKAAKDDSILGLKNAERKIVVNATAACQYQMYFQQKERENNDLKEALAKHQDEMNQKCIDEALNAELAKYRQMVRCGIWGYRTKSVVLTKCFHSFCKSCIDKCLEMKQRKCPNCMTKFGPEDVRTFWWK